MSKPPAFFTIQDMQLNYLHVTRDSWQHEYAEARLLGIPHEDLYYTPRRVPARKLGRMADVVMLGNIKLYTNCHYWVEL